MSKHTTIDQLKMLAQRSKTEIDKVDGRVSALSTRVDELVAAGGEPNVITSVKVNGTAQAIADKAVDITVATKVSELANDSKFQSDADVATAISGLRTELMGEGVPEAYDTFKELADYIEEHQEAADALNAAIGSKVDKAEGKDLSSNDYTDEDKAKLDGIVMATDNEVDAMLTEVFGASELTET